MLDSSAAIVHLMFMNDPSWKSSREDRLRDLDKVIEMTLSMIRMLKASVGDAVPGPKAKSFARDLRLLTRSLEATIALRDKIAASQAARDARAALEAAKHSAAKASAERQRPRLVYSQLDGAGAKSKNRGPPNG
jgi:hypothetical protein